MKNNYHDLFEDNWYLTEVKTLVILLVRCDYSYVVEMRRH